MSARAGADATADRAAAAAAGAGGAPAEAEAAGAAAARWREGPIGRRNVVWGWCGIVLGPLSGSILMAWSFGGPFDPPQVLGEYGDLNRRVMRLAHVAMLMLPLINVVYGKEIDFTALSDRWKRIGSWCAIIAMIGVPLGLVLASLIHNQLKYVSSGPVYCLIAAFAIMAYGKVLLHRTP